MAALPPQPPGGAPPQPPVAPPPMPPLPPQPGVFGSQMPQPAYAGVYGAPMPAPVVPRRHRTGMILLAQILMIVKGIFWLLGGIVAIAAAVYLLVHGGDIRGLPGYASYYGASVQSFVSVAVGLIMAFGVVLLVIGIVDLILGVTVGRPSNVSRWFTIVVNVITAVIAISGLVNVLGHNPTLGGVLFFAVWLGFNAVIFYALALDGASRHAFG